MSTVYVGNATRKGPPPPSVVPRERVYGTDPIAVKRMVDVAWAEGYRAGELAARLSTSSVPLTPIEIILKQVADKYGISQSELLSHRRHRGLVLARHEAAWRAKHETLYSNAQIARALGGRERTTILHGIRQHQKRLDMEASG